MAERSNKVLVIYELVPGKKINVKLFLLSPPAKVYLDFEAKSKPAVYEIELALHYAVVP
jgi:hypothetical protein